MQPMMQPMIQPIMQPMMQPMMQPVALNCPAAFKLTCRAEKLEAKDGVRIAGLGSTSDPYVIVRNLQNQICGKSAVIKKTLNPKWAPFEVDAYQCGGMNAPIIIEVKDWDSDGKDESIGEFRTTLQELTTKVNTSFELICMKKRGRAFYKNSGRFSLVGAEVIAMASKHAKAVEFVFEAKGLDRKDISGKSDPFFVILGCPKVFNAFGGFWGTSLTAYNKALKPGKKTKYSGIAGTATIVYKSKPILKNLNPLWEPFVFETRLAGCPNTPLIIEVWDYDKSGEHDFIGSFTTSIRDLMVEGAKFAIINKIKKDVPFYRNSGTFFVKSAKPTNENTIGLNELAITHVKLVIAGKNLASRDFFSKSDPFITFKSHTGALIYRSEEYMNQKNPEFKEIMIPVANCGGLDGRIKVTFWDWDYKGTHDVIGETTITLRELSFFTQNPSWRLVCDKYKGTLGYKNSGFMVVKKVEFVQGPPIANVFTPGMGFQPIVAQGATQIGITQMMSGQQVMGAPMRQMSAVSLIASQPMMGVGAGVKMAPMVGGGYGGMPVMGQGYGGMPMMGQSYGGVPMMTGMGGMPPGMVGGMPMMSGGYNMAGGMQGMANTPMMSGCQPSAPGVSAPAL